MDEDERRARGQEQPHGMHNADIAALFNRLADLLEISEANPFRVRAYRNAARLIESFPRQAVEILDAGEDLSALPGIGKDLAAKIAVAAHTGWLPALDELQQQVPGTLCDLLRIPGLGPKRVHTLYRERGVTSVEDLRRALRSGQLKGVHGFGDLTESRIRDGLDRLAQSQRRLPLAQAERVGRELAGYLRETDGLQALEVAGSFRRRKETVGDLDLLASGPPTVMERFLSYPAVAKVLSHGTARSTVLLRSGLQVDLRLVPPECFGAALAYFTGSKAHNIALRTLGLQRGLKINEYGVFREDARVAGRTEAEVYAQVGLPLIPPELRENTGELEAAARGRLPELVTVADIRGDLHAHTSATDGHDTLEAMAMAATAKGYEYLAITDHSRHLTIAHGQDEQRLRGQMAAIDALNRRLRGLTLLKAVELDILEDGALDFPDRLLAELDLVVCAVHSRFDLPTARQTERMLRAMDNPHCHVLAHPSGRLIGQRPPYPLDMERVIAAAKERGVWLEVNAQPERLDLNDVYCRFARELEARLVISTDAHSTGQLYNMGYGVDQARRGWLTAADVVNTNELATLRRLRRQ
jgi:DNA polymerase (family X)